MLTNFIVLQKDTCENTTAGILKTIIKSRVICLRAANSDSVKLTLECDPDDSLTESEYTNRVILYLIIIMFSNI